MASEPRVLLLAPEVPYPVVGGGPLRSASLVEYLACRSRLDAVVFREPGAADPRNTRLRDLARRITVINLPYHRRDSLSRAARNLRRALRGVPPLLDRFSGFDTQVSEGAGETYYDLALIEHFWCAGYKTLLAQRARRVILDLHNIESVLHASYSKSTPQPLAYLHRCFARACESRERSWLPEFSAVMVASDDDAQRVREIAPACRTAVYPNAIPLVPAPPRCEREVIAFTGNMEYLPNLEAARFFHGEVWPLLSRDWPNLEWHLAGKNPQVVRKYVDGDPRIRLIGPMDDAVAVLSSCKAAVVPVRSGSGTRVKILEAWAAATAVVSTTFGAEGVPTVAGEHLLIGDDPRDFAQAVSSLLASDDLRRRIGLAGRKLYEREFTWEAAWRKLDTFPLIT